MAQSLARLWTHLIFSTKDRFPFLRDKVLRSEMHAYLAEMLRTHDCETLIVGGIEDHAPFIVCAFTNPFDCKRRERGQANLVGLD